MRRDNILPITVAFVAVLAHVSHAAVLDLDAGSISDGKIVHDGTTYNVLSDENVFLIASGRTSGYRRVTVENADEIKRMSDELDYFSSKADLLAGEITQLDKKSAELEADIENTVYITEKVQAERDAAQTDIVRLRGQKTEAEVKATGMITVSPLSFRIGLAVFVMLAVLVVGMKAGSVMSMRSTSGTAAKSSAARMKREKADDALKPDPVQPTPVTVPVQEQQSTVTAAQPGPEAVQSPNPYSQINEVK